MASDHDEIIEPGDSRSAQRHLVHGPLHCSLGKVIDLSSQGALVVMRSQPPQGVVPFQVSDGHNTLMCAANVVWARRCGLFRHEAGLMFPELSADQIATVRRIVEAHSFSSTYSARREAA